MGFEVQGEEFFVKGGGLGGDRLNNWRRGRGGKRFMDGVGRTESEKEG